MRKLGCLLTLLTAAPLAGEAGLPVKVLVIGDSMSAEYAHEHPFSAPDSDPFKPNTSNWIEIFDAERSGFLDFGDDRVYPDVRGPGFKYNWGVPGATADFWCDVLDSSLFDDPHYFTSKINLLDQVDEIDVVVLFLGGNDVNSNYGGLYNDSPAPGLKTGFVADIAELIDTLRDKSPSVPVVLVNVPDVGITPDVQRDHPLPEQRADATAHIADLNRMLEPLADSHGVTIVDLFSFTTRLRETDPFHIGTVRMSKSFHPENPPEFLFCKLAFHPASGAQALIGNQVVAGINKALGLEIPPMTEREIVEKVLKLNPDQPFLDWIATHPGATAELSADDDRDGLSNLGEFALQANPLLTDPPAAPFPEADGMMVAFHPDPDAARLVDTVAEESTDLLGWSEVPAERLAELPGNGVGVRLPGAGRVYVRLRFSLVP